VAAEVLRNHRLLQPQVDAICAERDRLVLELSEIEGLRVYPSAANFVLFRVERADLDHRELFGALLERHGVLIRDVSGYPMLERCLRVNAGSPAENDTFLSAVRELLRES
jgi:histidinol-phosphate aminotransferase